MSTGREDRDGPTLPPNRLISIVLLSMASGVVLGASAMFYVTRMRILPAQFDPWPMIVLWAVVAVSWGVGRLVGVTGRERRLRRRESSDAIRDLHERS